MNRKNLKYPWLGVAICLLLSMSLAQAQSFDQTIRGRVTDEASAQPLAEATIEVDGEDLKAQSDAEGRFRLKNVPTGRHLLRVTLDGYAPFAIPDLAVISGKETVLDIELSPTLYETDEVQIEAPQVRDVGRVSARVFTVEETKRFAAVYFDPARMAASFPGVATANDQANHLIIRGNSPNGVNWRMEGVDIVNPNHLTNAGTFSDRVTQSGGGTILLSTQLLSNSTFSTGAFAPRYGNALSGVFDINLRPGNNESYEYTLQAGLIGVDLAAEGPISRKQGSSFLANYRYSTVGLLGLMGISFGNEEIAYQDLAVNLHLPAGKLGTFSIFGMGGLSTNRFTGGGENDTLETEKDRFDISYRSRMGAAGITHQLTIGSRTIWRSVIAASGISSSRTAEWRFDSTNVLPVERDELTQVKLSASTSLTHRFGPRSYLRVGSYYTQIYDSANSQIRPLNTDSTFRLLALNGGNAGLIQPYANWRWQPTPSLSFDLGLHGMYFLLNDSRSLEPRASLGWRINNRQNLRVAYGLHSQLQLPALYYLSVPGPNDQPTFPNRDLDFSRAHHVVLSYQYQFRPDFQIKLEPYFQYLFNVPIVNDTTSTFSALNLIESFIDPQFANEPLVNEGLGRNYGVEFTAEKFLSQNYYTLFSGSVYESEYQAGDGEWRDTRFNGNYIFSLTGGREFDFTTKKNKDKVWSVNLRFIYQGGFRAAPIDTLASEAAQRTIYDYSDGFSERLPDYFRTDLRVIFKRNRPKVTRTFSLDIQNVFNTQNVAFRVYDPVQGGIVTRFQLGIIPLLSYRLEF